MKIRSNSELEPTKDAAKQFRELGALNGGALGRGAEGREQPAPLERSLRDRLERAGLAGRPGPTASPSLRPPTGRTLLFTIFRLKY